MLGSPIRATGYFIQLFGGRNNVTYTLYPDCFLSITHISQAIKHTIISFKQKQGNAKRLTQCLLANLELLTYQDKSSIHSESTRPELSPKPTASSFLYLNSVSYVVFHIRYLINIVIFIS